MSLVIRKPVLGVWARQGSILWVCTATETSKNLEILHVAYMAFYTEGLTKVLVRLHRCLDWPRCYKTFFMLNSTEYKIQLLIKTKMQTNVEVLALSLSDVVFIMLINIKMTTIVGISTFMSRINFMLGLVCTFVFHMQQNLTTKFIMFFFMLSSN